MYNLYYFQYSHKCILEANLILYYNFMTYPIFENYSDCIIYKTINNKYIFIYLYIYRFIFMTDIGMIDKGVYNFFCS